MSNVKLDLHNPTDRKILHDNELLPEGHFVFNSLTHERRHRFVEKMNRKHFLTACLIPLRHRQAKIY